ncbi:hypothetical protein RFI_00269 [Reticulomyxa filosa]|uniref:SAM domain-containing protein n=1 Tax=Reticulomyxa filosa TaxID=46433 RepID=X6PFF4_RETFI|nr:hypothetical protein RFI_00269 [Reticulomyxa filosa]|eukprot:ETO36794.1 hypothetical protein RFI_00269 [Reticulomyxa filosa]
MTELERLRHGTLSEEPASTSPLRANGKSPNTLGVNEKDSVDVWSDETTPEKNITLVITKELSAQQSSENIPRDDTTAVDSNESTTQTTTNTNIYVMYVPFSLYPIFVCILYGLNEFALFVPKKKRHPKKWGVADVTQFLKDSNDKGGVGLNDSVAELFKEELISGEVLLQLSERDMEMMGVKVNSIQSILSRVRQLVWSIEQPHQSDGIVDISEAHNDKNPPASQLNVSNNDLLLQVNALDDHAKVLCETSSAVLLPSPLSSVETNANITTSQGTKEESQSVMSTLQSTNEKGSVISSESTLTNTANVDSVANAIMSVQSVTTAGHPPAKEAIAIAPSTAISESASTNAPQVPHEFQQPNPPRLSSFKANINQFFCRCCCCCCLTNNESEMDLTKFDVPVVLESFSERQKKQHDTQTQASISPKKTPVLLFQSGSVDASDTSPAKDPFATEEASSNSKHDNSPSKNDGWVFKPPSVK